MKRPSATLASPLATVVPTHARPTKRPSIRLSARGALKRVKTLGASAALLALSGCYYYYPYGYAPYYYGSVPAASTQQETAPAQAAEPPNPAPAAMPDAKYPGPLYPSPPMAITVPAWPVYPAYPAYPAYYPYPAW